MESKLPTLDELQALVTDPTLTVDRVEEHNGDTIVSLHRTIHGQRIGLNMMLVGDRLVDYIWAREGRLTLDAPTSEEAVRLKEGKRDLRAYVISGMTEAAYIPLEVVQEIDIREAHKAVRHWQALRSAGMLNAEVTDINVSLVDLYPFLYELINKEREVGSENV